MGQPLRAHITWKEYQQLPDDGIRYEVLEGEIVMTPAPEPKHQTASVNLLFEMESWRRDGGGGGEGMFFTAPVDVILAFDTIVQPDLVYIRGERAKTLVKKQIHGAPDLVVEIFRKARAERDRITKLQIYQRFSIQEYWLVDLDARSVTILTLSEDGYEVFASGTGDTKLGSKVLSGFEITPAEVFERA
ncbi:MAG: Uma2 family endonuclease [Candidatus Riflebacteria bacterium]|nr:Uma2 family endonuclease [Candidatus Riflebacteria bacterium]